MGSLEYVRSSSGPATQDSCRTWPGRRAFYLTLSWLEYSTITRFFCEAWGDLPYYRKVGSAAGNAVSLALFP